jgi:hypothetical protein
VSHSKNDRREFDGETFGIISENNDPLKESIKEQ